jgi:transposase
MNATTVGVDLAKNVFVACVADAVGRVIETREFNRAGFLAWLTTLTPGTVVGMEACSGAHCWGRTMSALALSPRLMRRTTLMRGANGEKCPRQRCSEASISKQYRR